MDSRRKCSIRSVASSTRHQPPNGSQQEQVASDPWGANRQTSRLAYIGVRLASIHRDGPRTNMRNSRLGFPRALHEALGGQSQSAHAYSRQALPARDMAVAMAKCKCIMLCLQRL